MHINTSEIAELCPDIETASDGYANRFAGEVGRFFLDRQSEIVKAMLPVTPQRILEVGGGHLHLTSMLLEAGHEVWVHGTAHEALHRTSEILPEFRSRCHGIVSPLLSLPFDERSFDLVIAIRLISHFERWEDLLSEMCRVANSQVIIDYPPCVGFNSLYPMLFGLKRSTEKNTRPYLRFSTKEIKQSFIDNGFRKDKKCAEFFLPMVVHRAVKSARFSRIAESTIAMSGLTQILGSPILLSAKRNQQNNCTASKQLR